MGTDGGVDGRGWLAEGIVIEQSSRALKWVPMAGCCALCSICNGFGGEELRETLKYTPLEFMCFIIMTLQLLLPLGLPSSLSPPPSRLPISSAHLVSCLCSSAPLLVFSSPPSACPLPVPSSCALPFSSAHPFPLLFHLYYHCFSLPV